MSRRAKLSPQTLFTRYNHKAPEAEAFKVLRTNLQFLSIDKKEIKSILFTSTAPDEGKSTMISNLAVTIAQTGKKVILIDCDLRMPVQHKIFSYDNLIGLTSAISGSFPLEKCIQTTDIENLDILSAGPIPPNPAEMVGSDRMTKLLAELKEKYDYILIDAPPVLAVTDAVLLSTKVDGVILVTLAGKTRIDRGLEAKEQLTRAKARILGVVLNGVERSKDDQYYYYYYGDKK